MSPQPSHIDILPNELLAEIFKFGKTNRDFYYHNGILPPEVLYSYVSRRWRNLATNLPTLWTRIHIIADSLLLWLPHYLTRSQRCHLDVWIHHGRLDHCYGLEGRMNQIRYIMNLLIPHIDRWSSLRVEGYYDFSSYLVLSHLDNLHAPVLCELVVHFETVVSSVEGNSFPLEILQGGAPLLTSVRLDTLPYCRPPLSALITCSIQPFRHLSACVPFIRGLAASHALTTLSVHKHPEYQNFGGFAGPSLTRLDTPKSLLLENTSSFTSSLLLAISAPRLETLALVELTGSDLHMLFDSPHRSLVEFPALHTLSLISVPLDRSSYIRLSRVFPSITHLKVRGEYFIHFQKLAELMGRLRPDARDTSDGGRVTTDIIWPKLHTIMLENLDPEILSDSIGDTLCDLLAARKALGRPIERLVLEDEVLEMVERKDGLGGYLELWEPFL